MPIMVWYIPLFFMLALLGGCAHAPKGATSLKSVCNALIGPIEYNSTNKESGRHAGPILALDLKARNQVGQELRCPQYR